MDVATKLNIGLNIQRKRATRKLYTVELRPETEEKNFSTKSVWTQPG